MNEWKMWSGRVWHESRLGTEFVFSVHGHGITITVDDMWISLARALIGFGWIDLNDKFWLVDIHAWIHSIFYSNHSIGLRMIMNIWIELNIWFGCDSSGFSAVFIRDKKSPRSNASKALFVQLHFSVIPTLSQRIHLIFRRKR